MLDKIKSFFSGVYRIGIALVSGGFNAVILYFAGGTLINNVAPELYKLYMAGVEGVDLNINILFAVALTLVSLWLLRNIYATFAVIYLVCKGEI